MKNYSNKNIHPLQGFTLIELIVMLAILGLIAAIATTRLTDISTNVRMSSAINQISSDIEIVKEMSLAKHKNMSITFDQNYNTYIIREGNSVMSDYPGSDNGILNLSEGIFKGVNITQIDINGSNKINFDKWGNVLNSGTITLNNDRILSINKLTGFTQVSN